MEVAIANLDYSPTHFENGCEAEFQERSLAILPQVTDLKPFQCQECGFTFSRKNHLDRHILVHTGHRPFKCQTCGGSFSRRSHLKRHAMLHNEQNKFTCEECGVAFMLKDLLLSHAVMHIGKKPSDTLPLPGDLHSELPYEGVLPDQRHVESLPFVDQPTSFNGVAEFVQNMLSDMKRETSSPNEWPAQAEMSPVQKEYAKDDCGAVCVTETDDSTNDIAQAESSFGNGQATFTPLNAAPQNTQTEERRFKCEECGFPFARKKDLHRHMLIHTGFKPFSCDVCEARFSRKYHLTRHTNLHLNQELFTCMKCGIAFADQVQLSDHICVHTNTADSSFDHSEKTALANNGQKKFHLLLDEEEIKVQNQIETAHTFICLECGISFPQLVQLQHHALSHKEQHFSSPENSNSGHASTSNDIGSEAAHYVDTNAATSFSRPLLNTAAAHLVKIKPFKCDECVASFSRKKDLRRHAFIHTGRRPYSCGECGMSFTRNHHLQRHTLTHRGHKPYACTDCGATFSRTYHLQRHSLTHLGPVGSRPTFLHDSDSAVTHDTNEDDGDAPSFFSQTCLDSARPFPCHECGSRFTRKKDLRRHSLIHTGDRPFTCTECGMTFSRKSHLKRHANNKHPGLIITAFTCKHCDGGFETRDQMLNHICGSIEEVVGKYEDNDTSNDCMELQNGFASMLVETSISAPDDIATEGKPAEIFKNVLQYGEQDSVYIEKLRLEQHLAVAHEKEAKERLVSMRKPVYTDGIVKYEPDDIYTKCTHLQLRFHSMSVEDINENRYSCEECGAVLVNELDLQQHMLVHGDNYSPLVDSALTYEQSVPKRDFQACSGNELSLCLNVANPTQIAKTSCNPLPYEVKPFKCEECGYACRYSKDLARHMLVHSGIRPHSCHECGSSFSRSHHLQRHSLIHSGHRPYTCNECNASFTRSYHLQRHSLTHTGIKLFRCDECGASYSRKEDLLSHRKLHLEPKPQQNVEYPATTVTTNAFLAAKRKAHYHSSNKKLLRSNGEKPYKCDVCGAAFSWKQTLQQHCVLHTGGKPHQCSECGAQFALRQHLMVHRRQHSAARSAQSKTTLKRGRPKKEKQYKCGMCDASFAYRLSLTNHRRLHTGEKPFTCEICNETFSQNRHLKYHKREIHNIEETHTS